MAYDYKRYFDEIAVIRDLTNMPEEAKWRTAAPAQDGERHRIVALPRLQCASAPRT